jgi:pilus assembly protein CpaB
MKAVSVLVAQKKISAGTTAGSALRSGLLASQTLPASAVPADALSAIPGALSALTLSADLQPGQLLLRPMLVTAAQTTSGLAIPPGMMALTISFCVPEDVAGAVQAGSLVAVFDTVVSNSSSNQISAAPGCAGAHQQTAGTTRTRLVLNRVQVLSVGTAPAGGQASTSTSTTGAFSSSSSSSSQTGTMVTVAVNQANAERLIQLTETGMPYLALLTPASRTSADVGNLLSARPSNPAPRTAITLPIVIPTTAPAPAPVPPPPNPQPSPTPDHQK